MYRAQLLDNGDLIQADPKLCQEAGYPPVHIALTRNAWADCVAWADEDTERTGHPQDETGRLWDVLHMAKSAYRQAHAEASRTHEAASALFTLVRVPSTGRRPFLATHVVLRLHIGPGDDGVPVVTIGQPGDD